MVDSSGWNEGEEKDNKYCNKDSFTKVIKILCGIEKLNREPNIVLVTPIIFITFFQF